MLVYVRPSSPRWENIYKHWTLPPCFPLPAVSFVTAAAAVEKAIHHITPCTVTAGSNVCHVDA